MSLMGASPDAVRPEILAAFDRAWAEIAQPGAWWTGPERIAVAEATRAALGGDSALSAFLPEPAVEAVKLIATSPGQTTEAWVAGICEGIGELRYVELVGIVVRVIAMDAFHRFAGWPLTPMPDPAPGVPTEEPPPDGARKNRTWVPMLMPSPPYVLGAVPSAASAMNDLTDVLYMPPQEMADPDWSRGDLHRTQVELVAAATSHANECFY